ncbi:Uncharacterised protein [Serratia fonticola]|uniref:Uncharacterized protein n=1 Tax=Serratia fonticola TaxID=47917 RepID=A0A4U9TSC3_SERFO|nr:Uncharacterised protein [Serratia fonticola]
MEVIDLSLLGYVAGGRGNNGGDRSDNGGGNRNNRGNNSAGNSSGGFYNKYGNTDCIEGMLANMAKGTVGGPGGMAAGLAYGAATGGCFKDGGRGGW